MIKDLIVIDSILNTPESLIKMAKQEKYFDSTHHNSYFSGVRSNNIQKTNLLNEVFCKMLLGYNNFNINYNLNYQGFHYLTKNNIPNKDWLHVDHPRDLYAGVIYLNKSPLENSGTIVYINNKPNIIENKFNRLVFYKANLLHSAQKGFGNTIEDSRLTLIFFVNCLTISIKS